MISASNPFDHPDSHAYMMTRREINHTFAEQRVDFNAEGLRAGELVIGRQFTEQDVIVDIGSNSGKMIAEASIENGTRAQLLCIEPDREASELYADIPFSLKEHTRFIAAKGEELPLDGCTVTGVSLHNVIFRARDAVTMLKEATRVVKPGGFIVISSNGIGHATYRHHFERVVAEEVIRTLNIDFTIPAPPAEGSYLEDIPAIMRIIDGVTEIEDLYVPQMTRAIITPGYRLQTYADSLRFGAANTDLPILLRGTWRDAVNRKVVPKIEAIINTSDTKNDSLAAKIGPYFADTIMRGMFVYQKIVN